MKTTNKIMGLVLVALGASATASAQSDATASATATLITPISISKTVDMDFGSVAASATAGTVVLGTDGVATPSGGVTLPGGTPAAAEFSVTGEGTSTFDITLPSSITLSDGGTNTLTVDSFTSNPATTGTLTAGAATVKVGATLNVPANTPAGTYTNTTDLTVTVNYN